jgi:hypothetical protein
MFVKARPWPEPEKLRPLAGCRRTPAPGANGGLRCARTELLFASRGDEGGPEQARLRAYAQALLANCCASGNERMRLPLAAKIAFMSAGATGGTPGSPTPPRWIS